MLAVDLTRGWNLSTIDVMRVRLLEYLAGHGPLQVAGLPGSAQAGASDHDTAIHVLQDFNARGWLDNFEMDFGGGVAMRLSGLGRTEWDAIARRRADWGARNRALKDAIVYWL